MLTLRQAILRIDRQSYQILPERSNSFTELYVDFQQNTEKYGQRYTIYLHPKQDLNVGGLELHFSLQLSPAARFLANGFQSWSETRFLHPSDQIPRLRGLARPWMGFYGDEHIAGIPRGKGYLHAWTYTVLVESGLSRLIGSLNESTGFTAIMYDHHNAILTVRKDLDGLALSHSFPAMDIWIGEGTEKEVYDRYFALLRDNVVYHYKAPERERGILGWTSWYRHFTHISEEILLENLRGVVESGLPFRYFQIDDGWQTAVGDWFSVRPEFPGGMAKMAAEIRNAGLVPGIWMAPFVASAHSELARKHPDWLLRDGKGKPLRAGWNPLWGGWYHALDIYHPKVQEYLSGVFHLAREKWGYRLFKLDFLFAACLAPPRSKTRGQVMADAIDFLRHQLADDQFLACGVPLGSVMGRAEFCRIGGDVHTRWEHRLLNWLRHRERVSTLASLRSTLSRWALGGRAFGNDPDVFILRKDQQQLNPDQQNTLLTVNALLGGLLFTSDHPGEYSELQSEKITAALHLGKSRVEQVTELMPDVYRIGFRLGEEDFWGLVNLNSRAVRAPLTPNGREELRPFETKIINRGKLSSN